MGAMILAGQAPQNCREEMMVLMVLLREQRVGTRRMEFLEEEDFEGLQENVFSGGFETYF
jgi:hypothetical protein